MMREGEQERDWNPSDDHTPMEKVVKYSVMALASADKQTFVNGTIFGAWEEWCSVLCHDSTNSTFEVHESREVCMSMVLEPVLACVMCWNGPSCK